MVKKMRGLLESEGVAGVLRSASRHIYTPRAPSFKICQQLVYGKTGFEIGGPSPIFARTGLLPIYSIAGHLDNCDFSGSTVWRESITEGPSFRYNETRPPGHQYLREATALSGISSSSYDFVLSSHTLEHTANPLLALHEWKRLLKNGGGIMILVVPHKDGTFDHRRPVTPFTHLVEDFERNVGEDDLTHLPEILQLHDLKMDPPAGSFENFKKRSENNFVNRCLHHHVFDTRLVVAVMDSVGLRIHAIEAVRPFHIIAIGQAVAPGEASGNRALLDDKARYLQRSPFRSDRMNYTGNVAGFGQACVARG
jgi:SAM-dependent methyltransferase